MVAFVSSPIHLLLSSYHVFGLWRNKYDDDDDDDDDDDSMQATFPNLLTAD